MWIVEKLVLLAVSILKHTTLLSMEGSMVGFTLEPIEGVVIEGTVQFAQVAGRGGKHLEQLIVLKRIKVDGKELSTLRYLSGLKIGNCHIVTYGNEHTK